MGAISARSIVNAQSAVHHQGSLPDSGPSAQALSRGLRPAEAIDFRVLEAAQGLGCLLRRAYLRQIERTDIRKDLHADLMNPERTLVVAEVVVVRQPGISPTLDCDFLIE
jgi:hypothetical protein